MSLVKLANSRASRNRPAHAIPFPSEGYYFIDKIQVWLAQPLSKAGIRELRSKCGPRKLHVSRKKPFPDWPYDQRLQIYQPKSEILEWLRTRNDVFLNYVEIALDWTFDTEEQRDEAYKFVCQHGVKKHHRGQKIKFVGEAGTTRYSGPRKSPNILVVYRDRASKVTGEVFCVHIEWRIKGIEPLRRQGINSISELLQLNHRQFWEERLRLFDLDLTKLGRMQQNYQRKTSRRTAWAISKCNGKFLYDNDYRMGCMMMRISQSTQDVIDQWGWIAVNRCLIPISVHYRLPRENEIENSKKVKLEEGVISANANWSHIS